MRCRFNVTEASTAQVIDAARSGDPLAEAEVRERARHPGPGDLEALVECGALVDPHRAQRGVERFVDGEGVEHTIPAPWRR
jgi:hypothetical protein